MRILVLTPTFLPHVGGAEIVILEVYRRLARRHDVSLLTADKRGSPCELERLVNFPVARYEDRLTTMRFRGHRTTGGFVPPFSLSAVTALGKIIRDFRPDVINVHYMSHTGLAAVVANARHRVPTVLTFLGRDVPGPRTPYGWRYYCRWVARNVSGVIYVSRYCARAIFGDSDRAPGRVILAGVDLERFNPRNDGRAVRERLGVGEGAPLLLAVQRLAPEKRVDILVEAMPSILRRHPAAVLVIGGTGRARPDLESLAHRLGVGDSVRFAGYVPDEELGVYYAAADVFVFHSTYETFGVVLGEAMAAGKPVVSVNTTAIPEVVADGETGVLAPPLDPGAFADRVCVLLESPTERKRLGENARRWAETHFDWTVISAQYEEALLAARETP
jgi:glycosyltransferase involved in cell wall biosynthesis